MATTTPAPSKKSNIDPNNNGIDSNTGKISVGLLQQYRNIGFKLVPRLAGSTISPIKWKPIEEDSDIFWGPKEGQEKFYSNKLAKSVNLFDGVATVCGKTTVIIEDIDPDTGEVEERLLTMYLNCLDVDSYGAYKEIKDLVEYFKTVTFVTKSPRADKVVEEETGQTVHFAYHIYWLSSKQHLHVTPQDCKEDSIFEIHTDKHCMSLPPSLYHKDRDSRPDARYESVGLSNEIMRNDEEYDNILIALESCLNEKFRSKYRLSELKKEGIIEENKLGNRSGQEQERQHQQPNKEVTSTRKEEQYASIVLTANQIQQTCELLEPYYKKPHRNSLILGLGGFGFKNEISEDSIKHLVDQLCINTHDEEAISRISTLKNTYEKGRTNGPDEIIGKAKLIDIFTSFEQITNEEAEQLIEKLLKIWGIDTKKKRQKRHSDDNSQSTAANRIKTHYVHKHSIDENTLAEAIVVDGKAYFAISRRSDKTHELAKITLNITAAKDGISISNNAIIKPWDPIAYISNPYVYKTVDEFLEYIERARVINLDTLYKQLKQIYSKYIVANNAHLSICAADIIFSYFQDRLGMTHYLFFVGNNSSGKSNNLHVIEILAYRHVMSSNLNYANLLTCHGYLDEGQVTCSEDEADSLEEEPDKIRFHKNGYTKGGKVFKTEILRAGGRVQYPYKPFSWKCFAAEQLPDAFKARGFIQRIVELPCIYGKPEFDITEVKNPAGDENLQKHLDELNDLRKLLFAYRLLHYHDPIPNINLDSEGIITRNKQLFKPVLKLFACESLVQKNHDTYKELLPIIKGFVKEKRSKLNETFIAKLYAIIIELIKEKKSYKLSFSEIWQDINTQLHGIQIPNKPTTLSFPDHDDVSQKMVGKTIREILQGIPIDIAHNEKGYFFEKEKHYVMLSLDAYYCLNVADRILRNRINTPNTPFIDIDKTPL